MLREILLVRRQSGTEEVMSAVEAEFTHFDHSLVCGPPFCPHPIGGDHHPGPIVPQPAVHKYFLVWIIPHQSQESCEEFVLRERTVPRNGNILHSVAAHLFPLALGPVATRIDDNVNPHLRQRLVTSLIWLRPTKEPRCYFTEIANAIDSPLLAGLACAVKMRMRYGACWLVGPLFATTYHDRHQQRDGERLETAKPENHRESSRRIAKTLASYSYARARALMTKAKGPVARARIWRQNKTCLIRPA